MPSSSKAHLIRDFIAGGLGVVLVSYIANHVEPSLAGFVAGMPIGLCLIYFVAGYKESLNYTVAHSLSMIILSCVTFIFYYMYVVRKANKTRTLIYSFIFWILAVLVLWRIQVKHWYV